MQDQRLEWLKPRMDSLFEFKAKQDSLGMDFNTQIQSGREYRNPRICEKLIERFNIKQYGSNSFKYEFGPDAYYDSKMFRRIKERRDKEKGQQHQH